MSDQPLSGSRWEPSADEPTRPLASRTPDEPAPRNADEPLGQPLLACGGGT